MRLHSFQEGCGHWITAMQADSRVTVNAPVRKAPVAHDVRLWWLQSERLGVAEG